MMLPSQIRWQNREMRNTRKRRGILVTGLLASVLLTPTVACTQEFGQRPDANGAETCTLIPGPSHTVARVIDAETLLLDDGSELRLIGTLSPKAQQVSASAGSWPHEKRAVSLLSELVLGQRVQLAFGTSRRDRYGRQLAHLFVGSGKNRIWVQGTLLAEGLARAYAWPGDGACLAELIAHEHVARDQNLGLWSLPGFRPVPADFTRRL